MALPVPIRTFPKPWSWVIFTAHFYGLQWFVSDCKCCQLSSNIARLLCWVVTFVYSTLTMTGSVLWLGCNSRAFYLIQFACSKSTANYLGEGEFKGGLRVWWAASVSQGNVDFGVVWQAELYIGLFKFQLNTWLLNVFGEGVPPKKFLLVMRKYHGFSL